MSTRELIIVDVETSGLDPKFHRVLEIGAIHTGTGERLYLAPRITDGGWGSMSAEAMAINRYFERRVFDHWGNDFDEAQARATLKKWLDGNTIGGANPGFDLEFLQAMYRARQMPPPVPHHRKADISNQVAAHFGMPPTELPGLRDCCDLLGVDLTNAHTAMDDAEATLRCFEALEYRIAALA